MKPGRAHSRFRSRAGRAATLAAGALSALLALAGCGDDTRHAPKLVARADLSLSAARAKVGEPVDILMTVEHPAGTDVRFPPAEVFVGIEGTEGDASGGGLEIVRAGRARTRELETGWLVTKRTVTVRGFRIGAYSLGPLEVRLILKPVLEGAYASDPAKPPPAPKALSLTTPITRLEVYSVLGGGSTLADLRGEAGPFEIEPEPARWGWALMVGLIVVSHVAIGGLALKRILRRREELKLHPPLPPPHETALAELARIRESGLLDEGRTAEYTDRVSDVLRQYLEERFAIPAPERTTEEFLDEVARAPVLDRERKRFLADYLARCDLVKFAAAEPGRRELDELFGSSVSFVEETAGARATSSGTGS